ncbi:MAG: S9 family peptidase [Bacteroidetes bacterium HGW-Bacteroidetes-4]|jgi:dipeptidyl-peptidase-4|nr:MAG: S9 family peptidase [Bacteroidetes bacterium HGW-Bacteroidetes-4]
MKQLLSLLILLQLSFLGLAQDKMLTMSDAIVGQWRNLAPESFHNLQWRGNSNQFTFQDYYKVYQQSAKKADSVVVFTLSELNGILRTKALDTLAYLPGFTWYNENEFHFYSKNTWLVVQLKEKQILTQITLPEAAENKEIHYESKQIAYTIDNNLYVIDAANNPLAITASVNKNIVSGQSVSRNEFGINGGIFWSPNGNKLAYYQKDESKVKDYPLVDITAREAEVNFIKYPMAGMASEHISVGVYDFTTKQTQFIENLDTVSEKYLTNLTWTPDEQYIYLQVLNRGQNHMKLNRYAVADGSLDKTLFEEKHEKYVEPYHPLLFIDNKPDRFIYQSRNQGYNHAYLYSADGQLIKPVTQGDWEITDVVYLDKNSLYYMATKESPIERHLYKTDLKNGKTIKLTQVQGTHSVLFNAGAELFIDTWSNIKTPKVIDIVSLKGTKVRTIIKSANPLVAYKLPEMKIGSLKAADGVTDLYYRIIKPADFDSTRKYPAIVYVYGGPHAQLVNNRWLGGARLWEYYMAQNGYVLFILDNRGSANRGLEFENVIHRQCGVNEMKDQLKGIKHLESLGFVDMNRIGVHGWSYGGFMTTSLMVNYPDVFKVGVAGGPVIDWKYYEVMYGERYMDSPDENPEGYMFTSLLPRAKDLKGKLLIIHGGVDPTVVWQHSQLFLSECIKNQVPVDYFVYPEAEHNVRGIDRIHLMQKVTNYFDDYLK